MGEQSSSSREHCLVRFVGLSSYISRGQASLGECLVNSRMLDVGDSFAPDVSYSHTALLLCTGSRVGVPRLDMFTAFHLRKSRY